MGKAVSDSIRGIAASVNRKGALQSVVAGSMQEIADGNHASRSASEEDELAGGSALAECFGHGIQFSSSIIKVVMRNNKVHCFQRGMAGEKQPVCRIPKVVFAWALGQNLSVYYAGDKNC